MSLDGIPMLGQAATVDIDPFLLRELQERCNDPKSDGIRNVRGQCLMPIPNSAKPSSASISATMDALDTLNIIFCKASYYVDSKGKLNGYRSINLIMRLWLSIQNYFNCNKIEETAAKKIIAALHFIEKIDNRYYNYAL
jgi:hypothetical protein